MHLLGLILLTVAKILRLLINLYTVVVAAAVLISWVNPDPYNPIVRFLVQATAPVLRPIRRIMPRALMQSRIDFAPLILFIVLIALDTIVVGLLFDLSGRFLLTRP